MGYCHRCGWPVLAEGKQTLVQALREAVLAEPPRDGRWKPWSRVTPEELRRAVP